MTFLEKYQLLKKSIPVPAVVSPYSVDCEYVDYLFRCKNCYYCYDSVELIDGMYTNGGNGNKIVDSCLTVFSEKCCECIDCNHCNSCTYLLDCNDSTDCHFSAFLNSCTDCFGCVGLKNKKYCILNNQLTKDKYEKAVKEIKQELGWRI